MKHRDDMDDIYREHGKTVYRFLLRMCGDAELAQDLTQDTFLRAMEFQMELRSKPRQRV